MKLNVTIDLDAAWATDDDGDVVDWCTSIGDIVRDTIKKHVQKEVTAAITNGRILEPIIDRLREKAVKDLLEFKGETGVEISRSR